MDATVSARVPVELRDQVHKKLHAQGSSPTALINSAYRCYLATGVLPESQIEPPAGKRKLSSEQRKELATSITATTRQVPASYFAGRDDDSILKDRLRRDYEALA